jgi:hypothetical protein
MVYFYYLFPCVLISVYFFTYGLLLSTGFGRPVGLTVLCVDCVTQGNLRLSGGGGECVFENLLLSGVEFALYFIWGCVCLRMCHSCENCLYLFYRYAISPMCLGVFLSSLFLRFP